MFPQSSESIKKYIKGIITYHQRKHFSLSNADFVFQAE